MLALGSNIGQLQSNRSSASCPKSAQRRATSGRRCGRFNLGYTFIGLTNVVRPGDQIDLNLDPVQFPPGVPGTFPQFAFHDSDLWLQGLNFGIECNF